MLPGFLELFSPNLLVLPFSFSPGHNVALDRIIFEQARAGISLAVARWYYGAGARRYTPYIVESTTGSFEEYVRTLSKNSA
jgi:hypothetical protein